MKARTVQGYKAQQMKKPGFKKAWAELDAEFELLESMLQMREQAGLSQQRLSEKIDARQPAFSRLEHSGSKKTTGKTLRKIDKAGGRA